MTRGGSCPILPVSLLAYFRSRHRCHYCSMARGSAHSRPTACRLVPSLIILLGLLQPLLPPTCSLHFLHLHLHHRHAYTFSSIPRLIRHSYRRSCCREPFN